MLTVLESTGLKFVKTNTNDDQITPENTPTKNYTKVKIFLLKGPIFS